MKLLHEQTELCFWVSEIITCGVKFSYSTLLQCYGIIADPGREAVVNTFVAEILRQMTLKNIMDKNNILHETTKVVK